MKNIKRFLNICGAGIMIVIMSVLGAMLLGAFGVLAVHFNQYGIASVAFVIMALALAGAVLTIQHEVLPFFEA